MAPRPGPALAVLLVASLAVPVLHVGDAGRRALGAAVPCASVLPDQMATVGGADQLLTVVAGTGAATVATLTAWERSQGCWRRALGPWIGRVGVHGVRAHKREGDGATPLGLFALYSTIYGNAPNPGVHLRYRRLRCGDWWDEDVRSAGYNTFQQVPCGRTPAFANGVSEPLWLSPRAYASFAVIGYNTARIPGVGSGIFLHASLGRPTTGCVAIAHPLLVRVLRWLRLGLHPRIAIATWGTADGL